MKVHLPSSTTVTPIIVPTLKRLPNGDVSTPDFLNYVTYLEDIAKIHLKDIERLDKERERLKSLYTGKENTTVKEEPAN